LAACAITLRADAKGRPGSSHAEHNMFTIVSMDVLGWLGNL